MSDVLVPLSAPDVHPADIAAVVEVLNTRVLSIGPVVERFEAALAARAGRRHAIAVSSGTSALHLIVRALGWGRGDEVITPSFSFVASTNCLLYEGVRPSFVDIDPVTRCLDPNAVEAAITPSTVGIVAVDTFGYPADWARLEAIAERHGIALVMDSCESLGTVRRTAAGPVAAGQAGVAGAFAFYPNKQITTGEGGAVVTDDDQIAALCRSMRNQGRDPGAGWLQHARLGFNYRMSEINAALGLAQAARLDEILAARRAVAARYLERLSGFDLVLPPTAEDVDLSWFVFVVALRDGCRRGDREAALAALRAAGIQVSNYFSPIHRQPYIEAMALPPTSLVETERLSDRTIALPFFTRLDARRQDLVVAALADALRAGAGRAVGAPAAP